MAALEEITAARWPRKIVIRRRLARRIRASIRHFPGATFADRRAAAASAGLAGGAAVSARELAALRAERDALLDAIALVYEAGRADALGIPPRAPQIRAACADLPVRHLSVVKP